MFCESKCNLREIKTYKNEQFKLERFLIKKSGGWEKTVLVQIKFPDSYEWIN